MRWGRRTGEIYPSAAAGGGAHPVLDTVEKSNVHGLAVTDVSE